MFEPTHLGYDSINNSNELVQFQQMHQKSNIEEFQYLYDLLIKIIKKKVHFIREFLLNFENMF